jgi:serine protease Do
MKKIFTIAALVAVFTILGFGVGAKPIGRFFIQLGASDAIADKTTAPVTDNLKDLFVDLSKRLVPAVVNIYTTQTVSSPSGGPQAELYRRFFEQFFGGEFDGEQGGGGGMPPQGGGPSRKATSLGTGFIIDDKEGLILTNYHVIADADEIKVILTEDDKDREGIDAKVVGADSEADVALLKIKADRKLTAAPLGDSDALQVGEWVMAVGNPFGHGHTVTKGIISAKERVVAPISQFSNYLQTDTPINPGNSGGPLINTKGEVIGINSAINAAAQGIGFAIPVNYVKRILPELRTKGVVTRGFIGVNIGELNPALIRYLKLPKNVRGVIITDAFPGDPAAKAGLQVYDVIVEINGKRIVDGQQLIGLISTIAPGTSISLKALRGGKEREFKVVVGKRPSKDMIAKQDASKGLRNRFGKPSISVGMSVGELDADARKELGLPSNAQGVVVDRVTPNGPADEAGFERGDLIVEVDQKPTPNVKAFNAVFKENRVYLIRFRRGESPAITSLDLTKKPKAEEDEEE